MPQGGADPTTIAKALRTSMYFRALPPPPLAEVPRAASTESQCVFVEQWHSSKHDLPSSQRALAPDRTAGGASSPAEPATAEPATAGPLPEGATPLELARRLGLELGGKGRDYGLRAGELEHQAARSARAAPAWPEPVTPRLSLSWMPSGRSPLPPGKHHLYVFVHGFHGNALDLRGFRNQLALLLPDKSCARFLMSSSNEDFTATSSFEEMGENLANEVRAFLRSESLDQSAARVSFVCHSFGSIIARAALRKPQLEALLPRLHTYISLSGPHLGMLYTSNMLVELGVWGLRKWKNAQCLTELSLKDAKQPTDTFLYTLSKGDMLARFTNVLLVSSAEDRYVPHHSARLQLCPEAMHDPRFGTAFVSMVHNILSPLQCSNLVHVDVSFLPLISTKLVHQLDQAIGRKAHIDFLEQQAFLQMFVQMYLSYLV